MRPAIVSGLKTGYAPVSYWLIFSLSLSNSPRLGHLGHLVHLHDDVILLLRPESFRVLLSSAKSRARTWRWSTSQIPVDFDFWRVDLAHLLAILAS